MAVTNEIGPFTTLRLPPDSTGKRAHMHLAIGIRFGGSTLGFTSKEIVVGQTSGAAGEIEYVNGGPASGDIYLQLPSGGVTDFVIGENLLVNGSFRATVTDFEKYYTPAYVLASGNDPTKRQYIDNRGNAFVRFAEGEQQMDAFGLSRHTTPHQLAEYVHNDGELTREFHTHTVGSSSLVTYSHDAKSVFLDVDTVSGSIVQKTSNLYHRYSAGQGQIIQMTMASGDTGKDGVIRRWGYYDDNNGVYFELSGSTMNVVLRTTSDGTFTEYRIPQTSWNNDVLDGSDASNNASQMNLDVSKLNLYWIDFAWLGAGSVRTGLYEPQGDRVVGHHFINGNTYNLPYMGSGKLPIRVEIFNTTATASPSRLTFTCASVHTDGPIVPDLELRTSKLSSGSITPILCPPGQKTPLMSMQAASFINGHINRLSTVPEEMSLYVSGSPVCITFTRNAGLSSSSFVQKKTSEETINNDPMDTNTITYISSAVEVDLAATAMSGGIEMLSWFVDPGSFTRPFPANFNLKGESLHLLADGNTGERYTLAAQPVNDVTASVSPAITWIDIG